MPGAGVTFFWSMIGLYALFGAAFALLVPRREIRASALCAMLACAASAIAMPVEVFNVFQPGVMYPTAATLHFTAICLFGAAALYRRGLPVPWRFFTALVVAGFALVLWFSAVDDAPVPRRIAIALVALVLSLRILCMVFSVRAPAIDRMITFFFAIGPVNYLVRAAAYLLVLFGAAPLEAVAGITLANYAGLVLSAAGISVSLLIGLCLDIVRDRERRLLIDPLTGLANRGAFDREMQRLSGKTFGLLIADIDHFKAINDTMGHAAGDTVLTATGEALRKTAGGRFTARIGGEEFVVINESGCPMEMAHLSEAVRGAGAGIPKPGPPGTENVTFSVGWALCQPDGAPRECLHAADKALYAAKEGGRNRVVGAPQLKVAAE